MERLGTRAADYIFIARRNNSLSHSGRLLTFGFMLGVSLGIALAFGVVFGAWLVLPFAGLEMLVLYVAFRHIDEHAGDYERVVIEGNRLEVEVAEGRAVRCFEFNRYWSQVVCDGGGARVALRSHGRELEIGRHLCEEQRMLMANELRRELRSVR